MCELPSLLSGPAIQSSVSLPICLLGAATCTAVLRVTSKAVWIEEACRGVRAIMIVVGRLFAAKYECANRNGDDSENPARQPNFLGSRPHAVIGGEKPTRILRCQDFWLQSNETSEVQHRTRHTSSSSNREGFFQQIALNTGPQHRV